MIDEGNYNNARKLINREFNRITETKNYHLLNSNAKQFLKIITEESSTGFNVLSDSEKKVLNLLNEYIRDLQFHYARRIYTEHQRLLEKPEALMWLSGDARYIFETWKKSV